MNDSVLLATYDTQVRRSLADPPTGFRLDLVDDPAPMLLLTPVEDLGPRGGGVFWCDLDERNADAAIAAAQDRFRPLGKEIEWKHFGYDRPADLPDRLRAAGFAPEERESLVVGEVAEVVRRLASRPEPVGVTVRRLREDDAGRAADWRGIDALGSAVWGDEPGHNESIAAHQAAHPDVMSVWLAVDPAGDGADSGPVGSEPGDGLVVCAARIEFHTGTEFGSLWGGSTLPSYRGRGIYQALVLRRAQEAAERGLRYLQVDASEDSRPILERLGLRVLTTTTPWLWTPPAGA